MSGLSLVQEEYVNVFGYLKNLNVYVYILYMVCIIIENYIKEN